MTYTKIDPLRPTVIFYAINEKGTNKFLPASKIKSGFTHDEPTSINIKPPRIFKKRHHAQLALNWWRQGKVTGGTYHDNHRFFYEVLEDYKINRVPERDNIKLEVVEISLSWEM